MLLNPSPEANTGSQITWQERLAGSCSQRSRCSECNGQIVFRLLAVPGGVSPGLLGVQVALALHPGKRLRPSSVSFLFSPVWGVLGFLRPSSFPQCPCHLSPRAEAGATARMLHILHVYQRLTVPVLAKGSGLQWTLGKSGVTMVKGCGEWSLLSGLTFGGRKCSMSYPKAQNMGPESACPIPDLPLDLADPCPASLSPAVGPLPHCQPAHTGSLSELMCGV